MTRKVEQVWEGEPISIPRRGQTITCCHCGLTHTYKPILKRTSRGLEVHVRIRVDDQEARNIRRRKDLWHDPSKLRGLSRNAKPLPKPEVEA